MKFSTKLNQHQDMIPETNQTMEKPQLESQKLKRKIKKAKMIRKAKTAKLVNSLAEMS